MEVDKFKVNGKTYYAEPKLQSKLIKLAQQEPIGFRNIFLLPGGTGYYEHFDGVGPVRTTPKKGDIMIDTSKSYRSAWIIRQAGEDGDLVGTKVGEQNPQKAEY